MDSALGQNILDIPEAQTEAMASPDRIADDLGRETIAGVTRPMAFHATSFSVFVLELTMPIPLRLSADDLEPSLSTYQWFDLFTSDGYMRLLKSLRTKARTIELY